MSWKKLSADRITFLKISSDDPYFSVEFEGEWWGDGVSIYSGKDSTLCCGVIQKIEKIIDENKKTFATLITRNPSFYILYFIFGLLTLLAVEVGTPFSLIDTWFPYLYLIFIIVYPGVAYLLRFLIIRFVTKQNIIILKNRRDVPNFLQRKKDEIVIAFLSGALFFIFGYILAKITAP